MEMRLIKAFVTLADTLNYSRASEILFISQSTLSKQITALETELHAKLLIRDTHSVLLTDQGAAFLTNAREILNAANRAMSAVKTACPHSSRTLSIGMDKQVDHTSHFVGSTVNLISAFSSSQPEMDIKVHGLDVSLLDGAIQHGEIDIGIMVNEAEDTQTRMNPLINTRTLGIDNFVLLASKKEFTIDISNVTPRDLISRFDTAYVPDHYRMNSTACNIFNAIGVFPYIRFCDCFTEILTHVMVGDGISFCPEQEYLQTKIPAIIGIPFNNHEFHIEVVAKWHKDNLNPDIQRFLSFIP
jgi:DNA-binding transcriptional LysR family regulator